jgi:hypothetical protein
VVESDVRQAVAPQCFEHEWEPELPHIDLDLKPEQLNE